MTKEKLKKEAEVFATYYESLFPNEFETFYKAFLKVAEPREKRIAELEEQIEKMKCCGNCKYGYCGGSSISIDKNGNRTFHNWNEEKQAYCDIGKNGKYQCWEIKEND